MAKAKRKVKTIKIPDDHDALTYRNLWLSEREDGAKWRLFKDLILEIIEDHLKKSS